MSVMSLRPYTSRVTPFDRIIIITTCMVFNYIMATDILYLDNYCNLHKLRSRLYVDSIYIIVICNKLFG